MLRPHHLDQYRAPGTHHRNAVIDHRPQFPHRRNGLITAPQWLQAGFGLTIAGMARPG
jgi:hypothetical protein